MEKQYDQLYPRLSRFSPFQTAGLGDSYSVDSGKLISAGKKSRRGEESKGETRMQCNPSRPLQPCPRPGRTSREGGVRFRLAASRDAAQRRDGHNCDPFPCPSRSESAVPMPPPFARCLAPRRFYIHPCGGGDMPRRSPVRRKCTRRSLALISWSSSRIRTGSAMRLVPDITPAVNPFRIPSPRRGMLPRIVPFLGPHSSIAPTAATFQERVGSSREEGAQEKQR